MHTSGYLELSSVLLHWMSGNELSLFALGYSFSIECRRHVVGNKESSSGFELLLVIYPDGVPWGFPNSGTQLIGVLDLLLLISWKSIPVIKPIYPRCKSVLYLDLPNDFYDYFLTVF